MEWEVCDRIVEESARRESESVMDELLVVALEGDNLKGGNEFCCCGQEGRRIRSIVEFILPRIIFVISTMIFCNQPSSESLKIILRQGPTG